MGDILWIAAGTALVVGFWFLLKFWRTKQLRGDKKRVAVKLKHGEPPDDIYPLW
jgi:hypothetical protein